MGLLENAPNEHVSYKYAGGPVPRFEDKTSPPIGAIQGLVFRLGKDAAGRVYAWHSGSVKGTTSEFLNFYADDVVVALHFNYGAGPVDTVAGALRSRCEGAVDRALPIFTTAAGVSKAFIAATVLKEFRR